MTVSTSTHVTILKAPESNNCPLKISLVGAPQEIPCEIKDNIVMKILVTDFVGQECNFTIKVVFPRHNLHFAHLKNTSRTHESLVFKVKLSTMNSTCMPGISTSSILTTLKKRVLKI